MQTDWPVPQHRDAYLRQFFFSFLLEKKKKIEEEDGDAEYEKCLKVTRTHY